MDTSTGTVQPYKEAATPTPGEVKPIHIFSGPRRETDEAVVANLCTVLERDGGVLPAIAVRAEGPGRYRLIYGLHRLEAWERCYGKQRAIPAMIYPSGTPDELIAALEIEENLFRNELSADECQAQTIRRRDAGNARFGVGRGGRKWESESHFGAGEPRPRQEGHSATGG